MNGHRWWILPEDADKDLQTDISLWRNQDQNENQGTNEMEVLQTLKHAAQASKDGGSEKVKTGDLVAKATRKNPTKIAIRLWQAMAKYYVGFLDDNAAHLVDELADYHSATVDPKDLCVSIQFVDLVASEEGLKERPYLRHYLVTTQYCTEKVIEGGPCGARISQLLDKTVITTLAKKPDQVKLVEEALIDLRAKYLPTLIESLGELVAGLEMAVYAGLVVRCVIGKGWPEDMMPRLTVPIGKLSNEKILDLGKHWAKVVDLKYPGISFAESAGLLVEDESQELDSQEVGLKALKRSASCPEPEATKFKRGDSATVIKRMSWPLPTKKNPEFRKDLVEGMEGTIEGWADPEKGQVLFKVSLQVDGKSKEITRTCFAHNLQLTSDYVLGKGPAAPGEGANPEDEEEKEGESNTFSKKFKWALGGSASKDVKVDTKLKALSSDNDHLIRNLCVRSRISLGLQALYETLPKYTGDDFVLVHRKGEKGVWKTEVHTQKDFVAWEILLAPHSSQIKDSHIMSLHHAVVTLPKHGRGAEPENKALALDGRCRHLMNSAGTSDEEEHTGSIYWIVTRTGDPKICNLEYENMTWEQQIKVNLPGPAMKARKLETRQEWASSELPMYPVLVNKKAIKKHTLLCVYHKDLKDTQKK